MTDMRSSASVLFILLCIGSVYCLECEDKWDTRSCEEWAKTKSKCNLSGTWAHIAKLCLKSCGYCDGGFTSMTTGLRTKSTSLSPVPGKSTPQTTVSPPTPDPSGSDTRGDYCPAATKYGSGPPANCKMPTDPQNRLKSGIESWFTKEMFHDLFPKANIGWGPVKCWPYSYESFIIAARYFPRFGTESPNSIYTADENYRRDLATFFAHVIQEVGENDYGLYRQFSDDKAANCFYRGGFFSWFEGGPSSGFLDPAHPGSQPNDSRVCNVGGRYCAAGMPYDYFYPCNVEKSGAYYKGCYFGRGPIQLSYNYNYGAFSSWLNEQGIEVDLLREPWQVTEKMDPPLAIMASLWFYMTPQPPKPAMHDIIMGNWEPGKTNRDAGYAGPIFGPTSLIINNECGGEDPTEPGGAGESRRIKAFKWFAEYFKFPVGPDQTMSCKNMPQRFNEILHKQSYGPDWSSTWKSEPCKCVPMTYGGPIPYYEEGYYPAEFVNKNIEEKKRCEKILRSNPAVFQVPPSSACLKA